MAERVRVAHCLQQAHSGGVERRRLSLARRLDRARFEQLLLCTEASEALRRDFEAAGCRVAEIGPMGRGLNWSKVRKAARILREFRPHIVHGAVFEGVITAAFAGTLARVPIIIAEETSDPAGRTWRGHLYFRALCAASDKVVAVSQAVADYLTNDLRISPGKVQLIRNGVNEPPAATPEEIDEVRVRFGLTPDHLVIGSVGRLAAPAGQPPDAHKRISDTIIAMKKVLAAFPEARLLLVGDGPDREWLQDRASAEGVRDAIVFAGFQSRPRPLLECMDLLVHSAASEAFGLVLVEAMFAELPVVATRAGGIPEIVEHDRTGVLVPPRDPQQLGDAIIRLLADPQRRSAMGAAGLRRARERFSEDRYVAEVAGLYEDRLERRRLNP